MQAKQHNSMSSEYYIEGIVAIVGNATATAMGISAEDARTMIDANLRGDIAALLDSAERIVSQDK